MGAWSQSYRAARATRRAVGAANSESRRVAPARAARIAIGLQFAQVADLPASRKPAPTGRFRITHDRHALIIVAKQFGIQ